MRYTFHETTLLIVLFWLPLPLPLHAQKVELAAGAGVTTNSLPAINENFSGDKAALGFAASVKARYKVRRRLSVGVGVDMQQLRTVSEIRYTNLEPGISQQVYNIGVPAISFYAIAEKYLWFRSLEINAGVHAGGTVANNHRTGADKINYPRSTGYMVGLVVGTGVRLSRHFCIRTELAPRYHLLFFGRRWHGVQGVRIFSVPLTLGVAFKL